MSCSRETNSSQDNADQRCTSESRTFRHSSLRLITTHLSRCGTTKRPRYRGGRFQATLPLANLSPVPRTQSGTNDLGRIQDMERFIDRLIDEFDSGKLGRREFCETMALATAVLASGGAAANAAPSRGFTMLGVNHISYQCPDY